jgi:fido (protein-threonine AMPylation protein)
MSLLLVLSSTPKPFREGNTLSIRIFIPYHPINAKFHNKNDKETKESENVNMLRVLRGK